MKTIFYILIIINISLAILLAALKQDCALPMGTGIYLAICLYGNEILDRIDGMGK